MTDSSSCPNKFDFTATCRHARAARVAAYTAGGTRGVLPFANFRTARLLPYQGDSGNTQLLLDGLVISWVTVVLIIQLRELREAAREPGFTFRGHFGQKWTAYEWVFISLFWGILSMKYYVRSSMAELERFAPFEPNTHYPLHTTGQASLVENNLLAIE